MKKIMSIAFGLTVLFTQTAGALTPDAKYVFADLQEVDDFTSWHISGWQALDSRSLIVDLSGSRSYLLILNRDLPGLRFTENISISSNNSKVKSRLDNVRVLDRMSTPAGIEKIYLLPDRAARQNARATILSPEA